MIRKPSATSTRPSSPSLSPAQRPALEQRHLIFPVAVWLGALLVISLSLLLVERSGGLSQPSVHEEVSFLGLQLLQNFGIKPKVDKVAYLHVFHFIVLLTLAFQLLTARRQRRGSYLSWALAACVALAAAYFLRSIFVLWPNLEDLAGRQISLGQLSFSFSKTVQGILSLASSFSFLLAGLAARYSLSSRRHGTLVIASASVIVALTMILFALLATGGAYVSVPIAATSVTGCAICAVYFFQRARRRPGNRFLAWTLLITFLLYVAPQFLEPLLYHNIFTNTEPLFLFSFITKTVAFLAVVALALTESHSDLRMANQQLVRQTASFSSALKQTSYAYFVDSLSGEIGQSIGEEEVLGIHNIGKKSRASLFEDSQIYDSLMAELREKKPVQDRIVKLRHADGSLRSVSLSLLLEEQDDGAIVQGFYHDITDSEHKKELNEVFDHLLTRIARSTNLKSILDISQEFLANTLDAPVRLYFTAPADEDSPPSRFVASSSSGSEETLPNVPLIVGDNVLNFIRHHSIPILRPDDATGADLRHLFGLSGEQVLAALPLRHPLSSDTDLMNESGVITNGAIDGVAFVFFSGEPRAEQTAALEIIAECIDQFLMAAELGLMKKLMADLELLWTEFFASRALLRTAIHRSLSEIHQKTDYDSLMVVLTSSSDESGIKTRSRDPQIFSSHGPTDPLISPMHNLARTHQKTGFISPQYLVVQDETAKLSVAAIPLMTEEDHSLGALLAIRRTAFEDVAVFSRFDQQYLSYLARFLSTLIVKFDANHAFRLVVGRIGHDFLAPIVAIKNRAHYLINEGAKLDRATRERKLADIKSNAIQLQQLSGSIDFFREVKDKPAKILLFTEVVQKSCKELKYLFTERGAQPPDAHSSRFSMIPPLFVPKTAIDRIVQNLVVNIAKYGKDSEHGRHPTISGNADKTHYIVLFQDWGPGVEPGEEEKIFEKGYRGEHTSKREVTGSGLGLFIARELARRELGGDLELSSPRNPTEFRLLLPKTLMYIEGGKQNPPT